MGHLDYLSIFSLLTPFLGMDYTNIELDNLLTSTRVGELAPTPQDLHTSLPLQVYRVHLSDLQAHNEVLDLKFTLTGLPTTLSTLS